MLTIIIFILAVSFVLYAILGGADFGAGIVEILTGQKGEKTVSKAIAPVWEANHVWLILAIVIIFTGFPSVYATISTHLHIPLMIVLIGIVLRGSSFTFRHYDDPHHAAHNYFTWLFRISSLLTPFFLGVTLGAMIHGQIDLTPTTGFYQRFMAPWLNIFCLGTGLFCTSLFGYIAAVFMIGEAGYKVEEKRYSRIAKILLVCTIGMGILVFVVAEYTGHPLFDEFISSTVSMVCMTLVALLVPLVWQLVRNPNVIFLRVAVAIQVTLVMLGWFAIQYPVLVYEKNNNHLTFFNTQAPPATLNQLFIALAVGLILVVPAFFFLFRVFKQVRQSDGIK